MKLTKQVSSEVLELMFPIILQKPALKMDHPVQSQANSLHNLRSLKEWGCAGIEGSEELCPESGMEDQVALWPSCLELTATLLLSLRPMKASLNPEKAHCESERVFI